MKVSAVLTDIEGTTSSIHFVHDVLFPYASRKLPGFVRDRQEQPEIAAILDEVRKEMSEPDAGIERLIDVLLRWIAEDQKVTPLKALQGCIWKHGYVDGDLSGHVYDDAVRNLRKWARAGLDLYVYSSGSIAAQKLLFGHSVAGDLAELFTDYFDTNIGHKRDAGSYANIAQRIGADANHILFLSDVAEELDAAARTGMQTVQLVRGDDVVRGMHRVAHDFGDIKLEVR